ncbi:MAG TPA: sigma-70 family RNA polymerase sigma factor [Propionibacteriaceae bacterium]|nr:sigma-70 family RNA polymerase sigma factor [Propionibacteriaceae bacterium]HPZ50181.1 sigma-70 family RNA polymerase sigma factor [Propionibacteriaceae bacterium]HQE32162.1 sigma-70 family RNA polymerase sigma factor [Propionibacteriaceae bacterium]
MTTQTLGDRAAAAFRDYLAGDRSRMGDLVDILTPLLWHTARSQRAPTAIAEDAIQTAWVRLVEAADRIQEPRAVVSWLVVTVKRETWRLMRASTRIDDSVDDLSTRAAPDDPAADAILSDRQRRLWAHIAALPDRCQSLLRVIAFASIPDYSEIATALGMPVGSIGPTRGRCLAKLRTALANDPSWEV